VEDGDGDADEDAGDDVGLPEGASAAGDEGEEESLEESSGFVEGLFEGFIQMHIEFLCFVNVFPDAVKDHRGQELLGYIGFGADEDFGGFVAGVWGPRFGAGYGEEEVPLGEGWDDFEGFGKFAGFVARKEEANSVGWVGLVIRWRGARMPLDGLGVDFYDFCWDFYSVFGWTAALNRWASGLGSFVGGDLLKDQIC
jgi:hypothetical protein